MELPTLEPMKIFLQHRRTSLYFANMGHWTKCSTDALEFPNYDKAIEFAIQHKLSKVHVVLKFADHPYNICLPFQKKLPRTTSLSA